MSVILADGVDFCYKITLYKHRMQEVAMHLKLITLTGVNTWAILRFLITIF